jgi:proteasome lid subunit RPN8/RPN11
MHFKVSNRAKLSIKAHASWSLPNECCGFIMDEDRVAPQENISPRPLDSFVIDSHSFFIPRERGEVRIIYHSHPTTSSEASPTDRAYCNEINIPFIIYSVPNDNFSLLMPE